MIYALHLLYHHWLTYCLLGSYMYLPLYVGKGIIHAFVLARPLFMCETLFCSLSAALPPHTLYFGVKFYAADPCKLREELTRY